MEKILFIVPPNITFEDFVHPPENVKAVAKQGRNYGAVITDISVGILSLSAYVKKYAAVETRLLDFNIVLNKLDDFEFRNFTELFRHFLSLREWLDYAPGIIGISALFTSSYQNVLDIAKCCRQIFPDAIIVAGGGVPTNMYREILSAGTSFNALCYGEGEKALLGLLQAGDKKGYLEEDPTWITEKKVRQGQTSFCYNFIEDLDEIPFYDYGLYNTTEYALNPTISAYTSVEGKDKSIPFMTSRGCTFCCCFCSSSTVHGRKMRYHSIKRVKEDLIRLQEKYGVKMIVFEDDHFMSDKPRALEIIGIMRQLKLSAFFPNSLALYTLDRKVLEALKETGVNQLVLSVESGSDRVLREIMHKPLNLAIVKRVVSDCRDLGIYTDVNILIGLPGETKKDIEDTRSFLKTIQANWFRVNVATPLVGTKMFEICKKNNYFNGDYINGNLKRAVIETGDFSAAYIQEMAYVLNLEFNFVENSDYRLGKYETALQGFEVAIKAKHDHALAYYYAAQCYEKLGNPEKRERYMDTAKKIVKERTFWRNYAKIYKIPI